MTKYLWIALAGAGGFALGVFVAKNAYENKVRTGVGTVLDKFGAGGGVVESTVDQLLGV